VKTLWNAVSFIAVVNLLAMLMFVAWLWQSQRIDAARIEQLRELFARTTPEIEQETAAKAAERAAALAQAEIDARERRPVITSAAQIAALSSVQEQEAQAARRLGDEQRQLLALLETRRAELEQGIAQFETGKQAWDAQVKRQQQRRTDEQFLKAVEQYESVPPKLAKQMIQQLVRDQDVEQAVAYLDAMDARAAKKILSEFKTAEEIDLATELLERLRTLGTPSEGTTEPRHAAAPAAAAQPAAPNP
jgi:hypothetical protein